MLQQGELVPKYDLTTAAQYGELVYLLGPTAGPFNPDSVITELRTKLAGFTEHDSLLLVGNPCIIGWSVAVAAQVSPNLRLLQWSGKNKQYVVIKCQL